MRQHKSQQLRRLLKHSMKDSSWLSDRKKVPILSSLIDIEIFKGRVAQDNLSSAQLFLEEIRM